MAHIHKILVPVDPSPCSIAALTEAAALADDLGASIDVVHVRSGNGFQVGTKTEAAPGALAQAEREMDAAVGRARTRLGQRLDRRSERGDPVRTILELAAEGHYDMIVMGTHGRVGRMHAMLGSVAEGVVRNAPCPVVTVRAPG